jgi:hypothetical protein
MIGLINGQRVEIAHLERINLPKVLDYTEESPKSTLAKMMANPTKERETTIIPAYLRIATALGQIYQKTAISGATDVFIVP